MIGQRPSPVSCVPTTLRCPLGPDESSRPAPPVVGDSEVGHRDCADLMRQRRRLMAIYLRKRLAPQFRELIMLSAAGADSSRQCSYAHRQWAKPWESAEAGDRSLGVSRLHRVRRA